MAARRTFTLAEANAEVPRLRVLIERLQRCALDLARERQAWRDQHGGTDVAPDVLLRERPAARAAADELQGVLATIESSGALLKDLELGLIDFAAEHDGRTVLLCWQYGEPEVAFWHGVDEGFAGRKPLAGVRTRPPLQ
ncbi:MAG TPA: DUF2203 domain-containing protein [Candidatus Limnocylindria bacterium]|nr:DUF2203 domain-containing protein [Candidatus Limnocylindria bacterium]